MAQQNNSLKFKKAYISLEDNSIIEHTKDAEVVHVLSEVIASLEGKMLSISFDETKDIKFGDE